MYISIAKALWTHLAHGIAWAKEEQRRREEDRINREIEKGRPWGLGHWVVKGFRIQGFGFWVVRGTTHFPKSLSPTFDLVSLRVASLK